jgi:hypothetical protein
MSRFVTAPTDIFALGDGDFAEIRRRMAFGRVRTGVVARRGSAVPVRQEIVARRPEKGAAPIRLVVPAGRLELLDATSADRLCGEDVSL